MKSDSVSIHGGGIYNSMPEIFEMFEGILPASRVTEGKKYLKSITTKKGHEETSKDAINAVWRLVGDGIPKTVNTKLSDHLWGILEKRLFGSSSAYQGKMQLLEMNQNELREITQTQFKKLKNSGVKLYPKWFANENPKQATPGNIKVMPIYPNPGGKEVVETDKDMDMFKIRVSYEWTKQDVGGKKIRIKYGQPGAKSAPAKVFIELGGKKSIVHDENWEHFFSKAGASNSASNWLTSEILWWARNALAAAASPVMAPVCDTASACPSRDFPSIYATIGLPRHFAAVAKAANFSKLRNVSRNSTNPSMSGFSTMVIPTEPTHD
mgnify:CR=1 FL=1